MMGKRLVVAALPLIILTSMAAAADISEHQSKNARKIIATLDSLGINNTEVKEFIAEVDSHVDHGYLYLSEQHTMGGKLSLRYSLDSKPSIRQLELNFTPDESHFQAAARPNLVMVSYHLNF